MEDIMNQKNEWDDVADAEQAEGPIPQTKMDEAKKALQSMKSGKEISPSGVMKEHFGLEVLHSIANEIPCGHNIPEDQKVSILVPILQWQMECVDHIKEWSCWNMV